MAKRGPRTVYEDQQGRIQLALLSNANFLAHLSHGARIADAAGLSNLAITIREAQRRIRALSKEPQLTSTKGDE